MTEHIVADYVIIGTGLTESIVAAALSKAGYSVVHIDEHNYYGGNYASFIGIEELIKNVSSVKYTFGKTLNPNSEEKVTSDRIISIISSIENGMVERIMKLLPNGSNNNILYAYDILSHRQEYSFDIQPRLVLSGGKMVELLCSSNLGRNLDFKLVEKTYFLDDNQNIFKVPLSKEDIFKSNTLSLIEKRKLMRFLTFASRYQDQISNNDTNMNMNMNINYDSNFKETLISQFHLSTLHAHALIYAIANVDVNVNTQTGLERTRDYVLSLGRYGNAAYLISLYGSTSEIIQSLCRTCAVYGGIYILGQKIDDDIKLKEIKVGIEKNISIQVNQKIIFSQLPNIQVYHGIIIYKINLEIICPAQICIKEGDNVIHGIIVGQSVYGCPKYRAVIYVWSGENFDKNIERDVEKILYEHVHDLKGKELSKEDEGEEGDVQEVNNDQEVNKLNNEQNSEKSIKNETNQTEVILEKILSVYYIQETEKKERSFKNISKDIFVIPASNPLEQSMDEEVNIAKQVFTDLLGDEINNIGFFQRVEEEQDFEEFT